MVHTVCAWYHVLCCVGFGSKLSVICPSHPPFLPVVYGVFPTNKCPLVNVTCGQRHLLSVQVPVVKEARDSEEGEGVFQEPWSVGQAADMYAARLTAKSLLELLQASLQLLLLCMLTSAVLGAEMCTKSVP